MNESKDNKPRLVFLVDDDPIIGKIICNGLNSDELEIVYMSNSEQLFSRLKEGPEVIVLDYYLDKNDIDGLKVLKKLKKTAPHIPVVTLTSASDVNLAIDLMREGAVDYVQKGKDVIPRLDHALKDIFKMNELNVQIDNLKGKIKKIRKRAIISTSIFIVLGIILYLIKVM